MGGNCVGVAQECVLGKCHLVTNNKKEALIKIGDTEIKNSDYEKLLRITLHTKLNFNEHLNSIIINVLSRVIIYMSLSKKKILVNSFFNSLFNYCPFTWVFHSRTMNNKINCTRRGAFFY